ncbi:ribosomal RNA small subunit methyltransferase I [Alicyclobacillus hesperidum subsp. aegles]|uniref:16S rRNA (cytidine(1402)-2'-O)-methyltransferase n=1 Tax=Alicyclobacillus hesperidum TaxID=89784 RepID=UPI00222C95E3|nr:16S rRNA (cytidine(1402)-2'-O)-methyltransferase [Alicyclobacillus hesperidum]GLG02427.1 ribosomal RNA small subunit methyltransferase I [Alicyclobacillus hesperidum subsp. aegles]
METSVTSSACLYVCSTPIGNLSDVSLRLLEVLREVDLVLCEDTRQTRKLFSRYDIPADRLRSYHQHNERASQAWLRDQFAAGSRIALVSDAGTPLVSDPGAVVVETAIAMKVPVVPIPGPSAVLAGLVGSGLAMTPFVYLGFPPRSQSERTLWLEPFRTVPATLVMYEAPHRLPGTLAFLREALGDKPAVLAKELTKLHESFVRGTLSTLCEQVAEEEPRGEYVVLIDNRLTAEDAQRARAEEAEWAWQRAFEEVHRAMERGVSHKQAVAEASERFGVKRRELYNATLAQGED